VDRDLERSLRDFVRLRTVSSDPSLKEECFRGAKFLASLLESLGALLGPFLEINCGLVGVMKGGPHVLQWW
jgi:hypothetical protein